MSKKYLQKYLKVSNPALFLVKSKLWPRFNNVQFIGFKLNFQLSQCVKWRESFILKRELETTNFLTPAYLLHRKRVLGLRLHYHIGIHKDMTKKGMSRHIRLHFNRTININLQRRNIFQQWGFQNYVDCWAMQWRKWM